MPAGNKPDTSGKAKSRILRDDEASAYQRWEIPLVEGLVTGESLEPETIKPVTAEQLEAVRKDAYQEGFELGRKDGHREGLKQGLAETRERAETLTRILDTLHQPMQQMDQAVIKSLGELAVLIAKQVVRREIRTDPGEIVGVIREAVYQLPVNARHPRVHLNPEDEALVREALSLGDQEQVWKLQPDPLISRGGCLIETESAFIDATVEARIAGVVATMLGGDRASDQDDDRGDDEHQ